MKKMPITHEKKIAGTAETEDFEAVSYNKQK